MEKANFFAFFEEMSLWTLLSFPFLLPFWFLGEILGWVLANEGETADS